MIRRLAKYALMAAVAAVPLENMVMVDGMGTITRPIGMVAFSCGALYVIVRGRPRRPSLPIVLFICFVSWAALAGLWAFDPDAASVASWTYLQLLALGWLVFEVARSRSDLDLLLQSYVLGALATASDVLAALLRGDAIFYSRYTATGFDPNDAAMLMAIAVPMAGSLVGRGSIAWRVVNTVALLVFPAAILTTASRTAFVAAGAGFVVVLFATVSRGWRVKVAAFVLLVGMLGAALVVPTTSWERIATVGQEVRAGDLNGRRQLWSAAIDVFLDQPLSGVGPGGARARIAGLIGRRAVVHSTFLTVIAELGVVGAALFGGLVVWALRRAWSLARRRDSVWLATMVVWMIGASSLSWETRKPTWVVLALVAAAGSEASARAGSREEPLAEVEAGGLP